MKLQGKVAIVTGGSRGIGAAISKTLAKEGACVIVNFVKDSAEASKVVKEIRAAGGKAISVRADVSRKSEADDLISQAVEKFGTLDILVNNAGVLVEGTILDMNEDAWDRVVAVNLKGPFNTMQAAAKVMVPRKYGKIINVSSISGLGGAPKDEIAYAPSKAALNMLTTVASLDLGQYGINVNCVAPGWTVTDMVIRNAGSTKKFNELKRTKSQMASMGRTGEPQDIANVVLFLASDESSFISGQVIVADGGRKDFMSHG